MNYLSLFSGGCGGDLAMQHLLGFKCKGYVEYEKYPQEIIKARIRDGYMDAAPIFGDIRNFIAEGYADAYSGMVDLVTGGFPCQPFSCAGKQLGADDPRNMWPQTIDVIRRVRPRFAFLENVPDLLANEYFGTVVKDLAEAGYDAEWMCLSAAQCGANHRRNRVWIKAINANVHNEAEIGKVQEGTLAKPSGNRTMANSESGQPRQRAEQKGREGVGGRSEKVSDAAPIHAQGLESGQRKGQPWRSSWWSAEPDVGRVAHGVASRVDRLKATGNGQVSIVATTAWRILIDAATKQGRLF